MALLSAATLVAGCTGNSEVKTGPNVDLNAVSPNYRLQIATFLRTTLLDREDFRGALIGSPTLKPVGLSERMVVCLRLNGHNKPKDKVVVFLAGSINQYVDSKPEQCGDAAYQPFQELEDVLPSK